MLPLLSFVTRHSLGVLLVCRVFKIYFFYVVGLAGTGFSPDNMIQVVQSFAPYHMVNPRDQQTNPTLSSSIYEKDQKRPTYLTHHHAHKRL